MFPDAIKSLDELDFLQGKDFETEDLYFTNIDDMLDVSWKIRFEDKIYSMLFSHVENFKFNIESAVTKICGLRIEDCSDGRFGNFINYAVRDAEGECVSFICGDITLVEGVKDFR